MCTCPKCQHDVPKGAKSCPECGATPPVRKPGVWGWEHRSKATLWGLPWLHICFKWRNGWWPIPAKGVFAIGHVSCGVVSVGQFGVGLVSMLAIAFSILTKMMSPLIF